MRSAVDKPREAGQVVVVVVVSMPSFRIFVIIFCTVRMKVLFVQFEETFYSCYCRSFLCIVLFIVFIGDTNNLNRPNHPRLHLKHKSAS